MSLCRLAVFLVAVVPFACSSASIPLEEECPTVNDAGLVTATFTIPPRLQDRTEALRAIQREERRASLRASGSPRVWFTVNSQGVVRHTAIFQSSGDQVVDSVAVRAARHFSFSPAYQDNDPICASIAFYLAIGDE